MVDNWKNAVFFDFFRICFFVEYLIVKERKKCSTSDKIQTTDSVNQLTFNQCLKLMNYNFFDSCFRRKENHFFEYKGLLVLSSLHLNILNRSQYFSIFKEGENKSYHLGFSCNLRKIIFKKIYFELATDLVKKLPVTPNNLCSSATEDYCDDIFNIKKWISVTQHIPNCCQKN